MAEVERLLSYGPDVRRVMYTTNAAESVNASFRKVVRRGCFPDEDAVMKLLYLRVEELYSRWGEGCRQPGWARVRNQLLCDEGIRARIERFLRKDLHRLLDKPDLIRAPNRGFLIAAKRLLSVLDRQRSKGPGVN